MSTPTGLTTQKNYRILLYCYLFSLVLLGLLFAVLGVFWTLPDNLGEGYHNIQAMLRGIHQVLVLKIMVCYTIATVCILIAAVAVLLVYSHRIAGPAYRIGPEAAKIAQGNLIGNIKLRKHDNLMDIAESLNTIATAYRNRITSLEQNLQTLEIQAQHLASINQKDDNTAEVAAINETIHQNFNTFSQQLSTITC